MRKTIYSHKELKFLMRKEKLIKELLNSNSINIYCSLLGFKLKPNRFYWVSIYETHKRNLKRFLIFKLKKSVLAHPFILKFFSISVAYAKKHFKKYDILLVSILASGKYRRTNLIEYNNNRFSITKPDYTQSIEFKEVKRTRPKLKDFNVNTKRDKPEYIPDWFIIKGKSNKPTFKSLAHIKKIKVGRKTHLNFKEKTSPKNTP